MQLKLFHARIGHAQTEQDLQSINAFMNEVAVKKTATQYVPAEQDYWSILVFYENGNTATTGKLKDKKPAVAESDLDEGQREILQALKTWRKEKATSQQLPEYMVLPNATLISLANEKPRKIDDLPAIKGLGSRKVAQYGEDLMAILNAF